MLHDREDFVQASLPPSTITYAYPMKDAYVHLEKGLVCGTVQSILRIFSKLNLTFKTTLIPIKLIEGF